LKGKLTSGTFCHRAGEELKGWHIYPLQLDDLSDISYSSSADISGTDISHADVSRADVRRPELARPSALARMLARFGIEAPHMGRQAGQSGQTGQLGAPSASEIGPIFYRCAAHAGLVFSNVPGHELCEFGH